MSSDQLLWIMMTKIEISFDEENIVSEWSVGMTADKQVTPSEFFPATVPGAVQLDFMKAHEHDDYRFGTNVLKYRELEGKFWFYKTSFKKPVFSEDEDVVFYSKGIDYEFEIHINNKLLLHQEGMFTPVRLILNDYLKETNELKIIIYPVPIAEGEPEGRWQARSVAKPPAPYLWDWHPRLIPSGVWDDTWISIGSKIKIIDDDFSYELNDDLSLADVHFRFTASGISARDIHFTWTFHDKEDQPIEERKGVVHDTGNYFSLLVNNPSLWFPHDQGHPYLYSWKLSLMDENKNVLDEVTRTVGFRKTELIMNDGAWEEPSVFPKSRSVAPFTLRINNRVVFSKGSNWVHPEIFYGKITREQYKEQLELVKKCNMNILRVWGGGITNKDAFHELCDEMGIMIWQEFPLACNNYPDDQHYLKVLEQEALSIIKKVKKHPSLVMWSGGNELFNNWSGMTDQSHALRLLNSLTYQHDRNTPFIPTSPVYGVGHGHYLFYEEDTGEDVFQVMRRARNTAYPEFGMPSLAPLEVLQQIIPEDELFPVKPTEAWKLHGGFGAWKDSSWIELETIEKYFGKAGSLEELVGQSQLLQSVGYKAVFEEARRQQPYCSMALNWCFNEPWPNAANNNLVCYPGIPKPAYYAVRDSLRPVIASASFAKFYWVEGTMVEFDLWMLNDANKEVSEDEMEIFIRLGEHETRIGEWKVRKLQPGENLHGPTIRYTLPANGANGIARISLRMVNKGEANSEYFIMIGSIKKNEEEISRLNF